MCRLILDLKRKKQGTSGEGLLLSRPNPLFCSDIGKDPEYHLISQTERVKEEDRPP